MEIMHFNSSEERLNFVRGKFEEIVPEVADKEVEEKPKKAKKTVKKAKNDGENDGI